MIQVCLEDVPTETTVITIYVYYICMAVFATPADVVFLLYNDTSIKIF